VKKIFQWVQDNIRYIAFEDGIADLSQKKHRKYCEKNMAIVRVWRTC
jgi:hypothetical protein